MQILGFFFEFLVYFSVFFVFQKVKLSLFLVKESEGMKKVKNLTFSEIRNMKYDDKRPQNVVQKVKMSLFPKSNISITL